MHYAKMPDCRLSMGHWEKRNSNAKQFVFSCVDGSEQVSFSSHVQRTSNNCAGASAAARH
jgi:hypothetical protein